MPKLLGISGSPRKNGNTEILLDAALDAAREAGAEVEKVRLADLNFEPCRNCGGCDKTGECVVDDEMQGLYTKFIEFDRFIIASPIFFKGITAQTKAMIDRCQCLWAAKYVLEKPRCTQPPERLGVFISTCGASDRSMFGPALSTIKSFYIVLNIEYHAELLAEGIDKKGAVKSHPDLLTKAKELGESLAQ